MLYYLLYSLKDIHSFSNIFKYITFRAVLAAATFFLSVLSFGPVLTGKPTQLKNRTISAGGPRGMFRFI